MPQKSLAISSHSTLERQKKAAKSFAPISNFLKVISQENLAGRDETYAEALARKAWRMSLSDEKESLYWALMILERTEGKVAQKVQIDNPNELVEQIYSRLVLSGMPMTQIRNVLIALGVDEKFLPQIEAIDTEIIDVRQRDDGADPATAEVPV